MPDLSLVRLVMDGNSADIAGPLTAVPRPTNVSVTYGWADIAWLRTTKENDCTRKSLSSLRSGIGAIIYTQKA